MDTPGIEIRPIGTLGGERTNFVYLQDVRVDDRWRLGDVNAGWSVVSAPLNQEHGISTEGDDESLGGPYLVYCEKLIAEFVEWARQRSRPDDAAVLIDDAVQQWLGEALVAVEQTRSAAGPSARIMSSDLLMRVASEVLDLAGSGALLTRGANGSAANGAFELAFRFAPGTAIYGGSTDIARNMIAERFLGLPRSTPRRSTQ
jgi:alkylation response protein AidB-like acyl-CoA dehydrogenase